MPFHAAHQLWLLRILCMLTCCCAWEALATDDTAKDVVYAWSENMADDPRGQYPIKLLELALSHSGESYHAKPSKHELNQYRTLRHVELGRDLDVVWTFATAKREQELLPIKIPIDRGLLGWRLLLINAVDQDKFAGLTLEQLKQLRSAQGHDWPDLNVLVENGFNVTPSSSYTGLFAMLKRGRIAYFPRALSEIWLEQATHSNQGIVVEQHWALHYPAPVYFFVSRNKPELAAAIEKGLRAAIADGSMKQLFLLHFEDAIAQAALTKRRIVSLQNTDLSGSAMPTDPQLWFDPALGY